MKSPAGGSPVNRPASGTCSAPAGSTNRSVPAAAVSVSTPLLTRHPGGGLPSGSSANGRLGSFNAVTRVVSRRPGPPGFAGLADEEHVEAVHHG